MTTTHSEGGDSGAPATATPLELGDLPPEVLERIATQLSLRDLASANATSRLFRGAPTGGSSPVERVLRERARTRGHARVLPATLPGGVHTWAEELFARERVLADARVHMAVAACGSGFSAFVDAEGGLHTCGEEQAEGEDEMYRAHVATGHARVGATLVPTRVASLSAVCVVAVAAGETHLLALSDAGAVYGCGCNDSGQLGVGDDESRHTFARVHALAPEAVVGVAAGEAHSLALTVAGCAYSWGANNYGQLGQGDTVFRWEPARVEALDGVRTGAVSAGGQHTLFLSSGGHVYSCGYGHLGRLGHGDTHDQPTPRRIEALAGVTPVCVSAGRTHSLVVDANGAVLSLGVDNIAALSHQDTLDPGVPTRIETPAGVRAVRATAGHYCSAVLGADGSVHACGWNHLGLLGLGAGVGHPIETSRVTALALAHGSAVGCALGRRHALYLTADGGAHACGKHSAALGLGVSAAAGREPVHAPTCIEQLPRLLRCAVADA